jgi:hypothetical protein
MEGGPDEAEARRRLRRLISLFDTAEGEWAGRALTRAVARAGRVLLAHEGFGPRHPVAETVAAAEAFLDRPAEVTRRAYFAAASMSYPFGAGEGCYSLDAAAGCGPGSGCRSGAGTLDRIAGVVGARAVLAAIRGG